MRWIRKHLLGLEELSAEEITAILDTADAFSEVSQRPRKKVPTLQGKVVVNLFFEPSTRTRTSFGLAARRMSADVIDITRAMTSVQKGETLIDTARNIEAMGIDIVVIRHSAPGAPHLLSKVIDASIVNAGDGCHEHPTQALLDIYTIRRKKGRLEGLTVAIVGDISHSRAARSTIWGLKKLGARIIVVGPSTLIPKHITKMGVEVCYHFDDILHELDVINMLRVQRERLESSPFPSTREYARLFGMNTARMAKSKDDVMIMAPGPINRGVEITPDVADGEHSVILEQVTNGLAVRMAVLYLVSGLQPDRLKVR